MGACSMVSGGVFFIPDEIKRKECGKAVKYDDITGGTEHVEDTDMSGTSFADGPSDSLKEAA